MTSNHQTLRQKRQAVRQWFFGATFRVALLTVFLVFSFMYIVQTSSLSTKGYEINDLEKQVQAMEQENQRLELQIASNRSMNSIQERLLSLNMVEAGSNVQYVSLTGNAVAMR
ncbi:MAG: hypothetical protein ABIJ23_03735 [Candidatus Magasanikbacteria bacterium]